MMKLVEMMLIITNLNKLIRTKLNKKEEPEIYIDNFFIQYFESHCLSSSGCYIEVVDNYFSAVPYRTIV